MPIYEYICQDCQHRLTVLVRTIEYNMAPDCPQCGGHDLARVMSRFAAPKSDDARLASLADPSAWGGLDESDPKSVANSIRKLGSEMGDEISRDEIEQMADDAAHEAEGPGSPPSSE